VCGCVGVCARACPSSVGVAWLPLMPRLILLDRAAEKQAHTKIDEPLSSVDYALVCLDSALVCQPRTSCSAFHAHYSVIKPFADSCRLAGGLQLTTYTLTHV